MLFENFGSTSFIYAFEPFSVPFAELKKLSEKHPSISAANIGLSNSEQELTIFSSDEFSEVGGIYNRNTALESVVLDKTELCLFKTLSSFVSEQRVHHIHFFKN